MRKDWDKMAPALQAAMDRATESKEEANCQLAIYDKGHLVLSLASGPNIGKDSLLPVFSCGKSIMATAAHILVQKGLLDYDTRLADLWPEFACNGKEDIRLWHVLSHRTALHLLPCGQESEILADWDKMCQLMAAATPAWTPGGKHAYQGVTHAWLLGETIARAAGKSFNEVVSDEILKPLGLEHDFFYTETEESFKRFVPVDGSRAGLPSWCADFMNNPVIRRGCVPSASAMTSAEALAKYYASLVTQVDGVRLLTDATLDQATALCRSEDDHIQDPPEWDIFGLGYALIAPPPNRGDIFGQGGACGSEGFAIRSQGIALAFTKNMDLPTHPVHPIRDAISDILELPHRIW